MCPFGTYVNKKVQVIGNPGDIIIPILAFMLTLRQKFEVYTSFCYFSGLMPIMFSMNCTRSCFLGCDKLMNTGEYRETGYSQINDFITAA